MIRFELENDESFHQGFKRICVGLLDETILLLSEPGDDLNGAVHQARKNFKKLRGMLRLMRELLGEKVYARENAFYRDIARQLAGARESFVALKTLDRLLENYKDDLDMPRFQAVREHLEQVYLDHRESLLEDEQLLGDVLNALKRGRKRIQRWALTGKANRVLVGGLGRIYARGYDGLADAFDNPNAETLHEWRKSVKYLWYQMRVLRPMWVAGMDLYIVELDTLSELLGLEHDYADLKTLMFQLPDLFAHPDDMMALIYLIEKERQQLQEQAWHMGRRLYAEEPEAFTGRHLVYWRAWRQERV